MAQCEQQHQLRPASSEGITNVTITRSGLVKSNGCVHWYLPRLQHKLGDPLPLVQVSSDPELTFASSKIVWEHMAVEDGPTGR